MNFSVDKQNKRILVERKFAAPLAQVWAAWTKSELLDRWWAPKPWKAHTRVMDFREGGYWLYAMESPEGEVHWSRADFKAIAPLKGFKAVDGFCDSEGVLSPNMPTNRWDTQFIESGDSTLVRVELTFDALADLETIIGMGFEEGFTAGLNNLDELLAELKA